MKAEVVKGSTVKIESTVYSDIDLNLAVSITGSTITVLVKKSPNDLDAVALLTKTIGTGVTIIDGPAGRFDTLLAASELNDLSYSSIYFESLCKLSTGEHIRSGIEEIVIRPNLIKTLN
jgi:hypothetical protein